MTSTGSATSLSIVKELRRLAQNPSHREHILRNDVNSILIFVDPDEYPLEVVSNFTSETGAAQQRWSRGHKARGQGHKKNPRPRTAFPRTDTLEAKDRNARGQGQGPRTQSASALQKKKKKKGLHKNFSSDLHE